MIAFSVRILILRRDSVMKSMHLSAIITCVTSIFNLVILDVLDCGALHLKHVAPSVDSSSNKICIFGHFPG